MFDWQDIRFFLAVVRAGSSLAAASEMGTSQSTVTRRIDALEEAVGLKLFERLARGYVLTDQGQSLLPVASEAEAAMIKLQDAIGLAKRQLSGRIRFAVPPNGGDPAIMGPVVQFMRKHPGVIVETVPSGDFADVAGGSADIAFRAGPRPTDPNLIARKVGVVVWQPCCSKAYVAEHGMPADFADLSRHLVIGAEGQLAGSAPFRRFGELVANYALRAINVDALLGYVRVGTGVTILPEIMIAHHEDIVPCLSPLEDAASETWIITRDDLRKTPHVRAFLDYIVAHLTALLTRPNLQHTLHLPDAGGLR